MTKEDYDKGTAILEQIDKINALQEKVHKKHNEYKETDVELKEVLKSCYEALSVLEDINKEKFKQL
jgi:hypothetical protein